jgi:hypothetical protein
MTCKLTETEFYCVKCKHRCKSNKSDMCVKTLKNGAVALRGSCNKCDCVMYKFVGRCKQDNLINKYGSCY